jgi:epoxyqueuosine reductase
MSDDRSLTGSGLSAPGDLALTAALGKALDGAGFAHRVAPVSVAGELAQILAELLDKRQVSETLLAEYRESLTFSCPEEVGEPRALVVVASPSPAVKVRFQLETGPFEAVIPPTYISSDAQDRALAAMRSVLGRGGYTVARARIPVKLLAVRTGLAQYGRNNVAYVKNMGSFVRLDAFCTDAPLAVEDFKGKGSWRLSSCPPCRNCHHVCPTGCIPYDGTVIDAERCLTYFNEHEGDWPAGLDPQGHNALVGCLLCQDRCPVDRVYLRLPRLLAEFDREETEWILRDLPAGQLPAGVRAKLAALDLEDYSTVLGRNLRALVAVTTAKKTAYNGSAPAQRGQQ